MVNSIPDKCHSIQRDGHILRPRIGNNWSRSGCQTTHARHGEAETGYLDGLKLDVFKSIGTGGRTLAGIIRRPYAVTPQGMIGRVKLSVVFDRFDSSSAEGLNAG